MLKLIEQKSAHKHEMIFDTEDEAFAFIQGLYLGAGMDYEAGKVEFIMNYLGDEDLTEAYMLGTAYGLQHKGRIYDVELDVMDFRGYRVIYQVKAK